MKKNVPTIREVAQACGVGPMTVSRVLSNTPGKVSAETRERVLKAVREMGYRPGPTGLSQASEETRVLGLFNYTSFRAPGYFQFLLLAILARTSHSDHGLLIFGGDAWQNNPHRSIRQHYDGICDGVLYPTVTVPDPFIAAMRERGLPFTLIGSRGEEGGMSVDVDNAGAARMVTNHLLTLGHRRIAYLGVNPLVDATNEREQGYRAALTQAGLPTHVEALDFACTSEEYCYRWTQKYLRQPVGERPTALFCWTDTLALAMMDALHEVHLRVPEDIAIIGFDGNTEAAARNLTTYRQPYEALGAWAVDLTLERIAGKPPRAILLTGDLIVRGSAGPPHDTMSGRL